MSTSEEVEENSEDESEDDPSKCYGIYATEESLKKYTPGRYDLHPNRIFIIDPDVVIDEQRHDFLHGLAQLSEENEEEFDKKFMKIADLKTFQAIKKQKPAMNRGKKGSWLHTKRNKQKTYLK